jgi:hypothetical protein
LLAVGVARETAIPLPGTTATIADMSSMLKECREQGQVCEIDLVLREVEEQ